MKKKNINDIIEREVHEPTFKHDSWTLDNSIYCAKSVPDGGRSVTFHQCSRKWTEKLGNYGFCSSHAKEIKVKCGLADIIGTYYIAKFNGDRESDLAEFDFSEKTDRFYTVTDVRSIVGNIYFYTGRQKMDSESNRRYSVFEHESDAWLWLYQESANYYNNTKELLEFAVKNMNTLSGLIKKEVWNNRSQ